MTAREIDTYVGRRLAACRVAQGLELSELAARVRISSRVLARIEAGRREVSAAELLALARVSKVDVGVFFEGLPKHPAEIRAAGASRPSPERLRETEAMLDVFLRIDDPDQRRRIVSLLKACVAAGEY